MGQVEYIRDWIRARVRERIANPVCCGRQYVEDSSRKTVEHVDVFELIWGRWYRPKAWTRLCVYSSSDRGLIWRCNIFVGPAKSKTRFGL